MKYISLIFTVMCLLITSVTHATDNLVVVVSKDSNIKSLNKNEIANIFLARTRYYPNGEKSTPIELKESMFRKVFYQSIARKNTKQLMAYWTTLVFTGKGKPPKTYKELSPMLDKLSSDKSYITYLDRSLVTDKMKIVYSFSNNL